MDDFFKWNEKFSVSHEDMDADHRRFLENLNHLYRHLEHPHKDLIFEQAMLELEAYAQEHFHNEERYMAEIGYPGFSQQVDQHNFYKKELAYLRLASKRADRLELKSTLEFMRDWFLRHIVEFDKDYARWLHKRPTH